LSFEGPYYVRFTRSDTTVRESYTKPMRIALHNAGPQLAEPITVTYLVGGTAREGIDYRILSEKGKVVIPANKSFGYVDVQLINNANNIIASQDIVFTITEVKPANLRVGFGSGEIGKISRLTITDECILSGVYTAAFQSSEGTITKPDISITSTDCREYRVSDWNVGLFGVNALKPDLLFIDNGDNSISIPAQREDYLSAPSDTIRGDGFFNPSDQSVTLNIQLQFELADNRDTTVIYTLNYRPDR
ncbi:MAG TPA: hypothetical protein VF646_07720, partial [Cytophagales bacterium]